ncbi:MAG: hypothetical protein ACO3RV_04090, partial [Luteolibacter sp.]
SLADVGLTEFVAMVGAHGGKNGKMNKPRMDADEHGYVSAIRADEVLGEWNDAAEFQFWLLEIQDKSQRQFGDSQVIDHLANFHLCDPINDFGVDDDFIERNEVRHELRDLDAFVKQGITRLLREGDTGKLEFDNKRVFIGFFVKSMTYLVQHKEPTTDNSFCFLLQNQIRVHLCSSVVH